MKFGSLRARLITVSLGTLCLSAGLIACGKEEEPKPSGYYEGPRQPKGTGIDTNATTGSSTGGQPAKSP